MNTNENEALAALKAEMAKTYAENRDSVNFANSVFPGESETKKWYGAYFFFSGLRVGQQSKAPVVEVTREEVSKAYSAGSNDFAIEHQDVTLTQGEMYRVRHDAGVDAVMTIIQRTVGGGK